MWRCNAKPFTLWHSNENLCIGDTESSKCTILLIGKSCKRSLQNRKQIKFMLCSFRVCCRRPRLVSPAVIWPVMKSRGLVPSGQTCFPVLWRVMGLVWVMLWLWWWLTLSFTASLHGTSKLLCQVRVLSVYWEPTRFNRSVSTVSKVIITSWHKFKVFGSGSCPICPLFAGFGLLILLLEVLSLKVITSRLAHLETFSLSFSSSTFVSRVSLLHP